MKHGSFSVILSTDEYLKNNIQPPPNLDEKDKYLYKITQIKKMIMLHKYIKKQLLILNQMIR